MTQDLGAVLSALALTDADDLPASVVHATRRVIADTVACTLAASDFDVPRALRAVRTRQGGAAEASVVGGGRLPVPAAAAVNAQTANLLDADETLHNFTHFACAIVMPALAAAEATGAEGGELVAAVATGYEIAGRIALSMPDFEVGPDDELVRLPGSGFSWAAFGAAAAVARLLGCDQEQVRHALGTAYVLTPLQGSLIGFTSAMGVRPSPWFKYATYGAIAEAGAQAAYLAREGLEADPNLLVADSGFWRAFGTVSFDWDRASVGETDGWLIEQTAIKPYPFCRYGHIPIDLFAGIVAETGLKAEEIDEVELSMVPFATMQALIDYQVPASDLDVMSSLPYALAMVVHRIPPGPQWWSPDNLARADVRAFSAKVTGRMDPGLNPVLTGQVRAGGRFRQLPATVTVRAGGRTYTRSADRARGDTTPPEMALTDLDLAAKIRDFVAPVRGIDRAEELLGAASALDRPDGVRRLAATLRPHDEEGNR